MKFFYFVWSNLKRKKLRTSLTLLSVLVAFVLFSLLCGLKLALGAGVAMADANRLMVHHRVSFIQPLPHSYQTRIARILTFWPVRAQDELGFAVIHVFPLFSRIEMKRFYSR